LKLLGVYPSIGSIKRHPRLDFKEHTMHISTMIPPARLPASASRGALVAADWFGRAMIWIANLFATKIASPAKAQIARAQEASEARRIANSLRGTDRRLADEIFAAADRHEREDN
jgi:hypothetical protein